MTLIFKYKGREKEYQNEWRKAHRDDEMRKYERNYCKENREKINSEKKKSAKNCYLKLKKEIFILLGNKCSNPNCPIPPEKMDIRCLQIDHIHGDGSKERKKVPNGTVYFFKKVLKSLESNEGKYQLLCAYCNWLKRYINNEVGAG